MPNQIVITQGEHRVSASPQAVISTLLGSCVACCLWDAQAAVGGMNHILLATNTSDVVPCHLAGVNAMELLINDILKLGGERAALQAKVFGGAQMIEGFSNIGPNNCAFVLNFLSLEKIPVISQSLGGQVSRHVQFTPTTGAVRVKASKTAPREVLPSTLTPAGNDIELL